MGEGRREWGGREKRGEKYIAQLKTIKKKKSEFLCDHVI